MKPSENCVRFVADHEGLSLKAYPDPGTGGAPWTIGCGRTTNVHPGDTCTEEQAMEWLREELDGFAAQVQSVVQVPLTQNQLDALTSFTYNVGFGNFQKSSLLRILNDGNYAGAAQQFQRWNRAAGRVLPGLTKRRADEAALFMSNEA